MFSTNLLEEYFPEDMCSKKEIEILELKHRNLVVVKYIAKFEELVKFCPYYNSAAAEGSK